MVGVKWHRVTDRPPQRDGIVLVTVQTSNGWLVEPKFFLAGEWYNGSEKVRPEHVPMITHWAIMPAPAGE